MITQNIDGLHHQAGHHPDRVYEGHGNLHLMRCGAPCSLDTWPLPAGIGPSDPDEPLSQRPRPAGLSALRGDDPPPHPVVRRAYTEEHYRIHSARIAAKQASLLLVIGTSGATRLPHDVFSMAGLNGAALIDINPDTNPFSLLAERMDLGRSVKTTATVAVPTIVDFLEEVI